MRNLLGKKACGFSVNNITKEFLRIVKNTDTRVVSVVVSAVILIASFGIVTKYYTVGYDVYYNDVNIGTIASKDNALKVYNEVNCDMETKKGECLESELRFAMKIAPVADIAEDELYRNIVVAEDGENKCYSLNAEGITIAKLATREEAEEAVSQYVESFERKDAQIYGVYTIDADLDIVTALSTVEETVDALKECGLIKVAYRDVFEENITLPYTETRIESEEIPQGLEVVSQKGEEGVAVKRYITFYENGQQKHDIAPAIEIVKDPVEHIVLVGTGKLSGLKANSLPWPTKGTFTSEFGPRWGRNHNGIDIAGPVGTPIYAPAAGVVTFSKVKNGYGNYIIIDHGNGFETTYAHLNKSVVKEGEIVQEGTYLGEMGVTGNVTGSHLHFEVLKNGKYVNPMTYIQA